MVATLRVCGLLTVNDLPALGYYCAAYARWAEAEEQLKTTPRIFKTPNNHVMPSPWLTISRQNAELATKLLAEFGMTPASRVRVGGTPIPPPEGEDGKKTTVEAGKFTGLVGRPN